MAIVLVVEDEDQVRVLAESYLEEQGHEVLSADTPAGALALLRRSPAIDLLFTDLDLKGGGQTTPAAAGALYDRASDHRWNESAFRAGLRNAREALHGRRIAQQPVDEFSD
jgi:CheY-like chemotaxis protein